MKLTIFLLTAALIQVHATGISQTVTYSAVNASLEKLFKDLEKQTGFAFFYDADVLKNSKPISIEANNLPLQDFLDQLFKDQLLSYSIKRKNVIISKSYPSEALKLSRYIHPSSHHRCRSRPGWAAMPGVNVVVKGTKRGVVTDAYGRFSIEAEQGKTLVISNIGYTAKEIKVLSDNNISVLMELSTSKLDEVQIIAYGQTTNRLSTGNVSTVKAADIEKQPVNNPLLTLQGRVPGLVIIQATGFAGSGVSVNIQGRNRALPGILEMIHFMLLMECLIQLECYFLLI